MAYADLFARLFLQLNAGWIKAQNRVQNIDEVFYIDSRNLQTRTVQNVQTYPCLPTVCLNYRSICVPWSFYHTYVCTVLRRMKYFKLEQMKRWK